jgi:DNA-binding GntR family transcriptional regulator
MVLTMQGALHKKLRSDLAARINSGELRPGDRLLSERDLVDQYGVARSVVRQALAGLTRDGLVAPVYPRGYHVLGPRILWLPRLRPLADEPWDLEHIATMRTHASDRDAATLGIAPGDPVVVRPFELRGRGSGEPWASGITTHPLDGINEAGRELLLSHDFIDDDTLERVAERRIIGYHERVATRPPTDDERTTLDLGSFAPVLVFTRVTRTTTTPLGSLSLATRPDRFEVDYLIDA